MERRSELGMPVSHVWTGSDDIDVFVNLVNSIQERDRRTAKERERLDLKNKSKAKRRKHEKVASAFITTGVFILGLLAALGALDVLSFIFSFGV